MIVIDEEENYPEWLMNTPKPKREPRKFNSSKPYVGWLGKAQIEELEGWVDNPRIDIPIETWKDEHAGREPNREELLDLMIDLGVEDANEEDEDDDPNGRKNRKNKLLELAQSIRLNGVRIPLVVTHNRRILDGNRRFFASLWLARMANDDDERKEFSTLPVWVLPEGVDANDEDRILTELNSINDCYLKWPYSVVAKRVYNDYQRGMTIEELQKKYHEWAANRIRTVIEASKVATMFIDHHDDSLEARDLAYRKLIWFDELRRSNREAMDKEPFRSQIFDLLLSSNRPFSSHADFRRLEEIYENPEAWTALTTGQGREALRKARFILDRDRYEGQSDAESRLRRINGLLDNLLTGPGFGTVSQETLGEFHKLCAEVPTMGVAATTRVVQAAELLNSLTSKELAQLPEEQRLEIRQLLERVDRQIQSYQEE